MNATIMRQDETRLLQRFARAGDPDALSEITRLHAGMVYGTCLRITRSPEHAADAAQETFLHLLKNAGRITGSLGGWLHQVAVRRAIDLVRRDAARRRHESAFAAAAEAVETDQWTDVSPLVDAAIGELDEDLRDILLRYYLQGQSTVQIAVAKGVSQPTISRRVDQALSLLRGNLQAKGVLVSATVLGGLMPNAANSAPAAVLQELGKMGLTICGTAASSVATTVFGGLTLKVAGLAILALLAVGGFLISVHSRTSRMGLLAAAPAQVELEARWGAPVDGVQARLRAPQTNWTAGAIPRLFVDVRNQGTRHLFVQKQLHSCEVEVDGKWFRPANTRATAALPSPFPPGQEYDGIVLNLDNYWQEAGEAARRLGRIKRVTDQLTPGKHTVRVAVAATADKTEPGKPVRAISNWIEIKMTTNL